MKLLSQPIIDGLNNSNIAMALAVQFVFPEATFGLFTGRGLLTWNGFEYRGIDRIIAFSGRSNRSGNTPEGAILSLSQIPSDMLDADWQTTLEGYTYDNAPCNLAWLGFDNVTYEEPHLIDFMAYEIDTVTYRKSAEDEDGFHHVSIDIGLETVSRNIRAATHVRRSDREHRFHNGEGDNFFKHAIVGNRYRLEFGTIRG